MIQPVRKKFQVDGDAAGWRANRVRGRVGSASAAAVLLVLVAGCAHQPPRIDGVAGAAPAPEVPWSAPAERTAAPIAGEPAVSVSEIESRLERLTLAEVVDLALRNSPATRAAWYDAFAAAARYGSERGARYPTIDARGAATRADGTEGALDATTTYSLGANLSYLLFDFGGRANDVESAKQALIDANWTHSAVIQDRILDVEVSFFRYAGAKAILEANRISQAQAESSLVAAEERHDLGLATIADVLQARTALSEVKLAVQTTAGQVRTTRGALAVSMGYPANLPLDIAIATPAVPGVAVSQTVDELIQQAVAARPDLQAARARASERGAEARAARSDLWPSLSVSGFAGRNWLDGSHESTDLYSAALVLNIPLFAGFTRRYDLRAAQAEADAEAERARGYSQQVVYEVFASHSDFLTAAEQVATAADLLASATESERVAAGRYREGVGDILDLLSAQRALASARALEIKARLDWFTALATLARDVGVLGLPGQAALAPGVEFPEVTR
ncbi:MAG TPA: TolC family protein [Candidatus Krumholzibacteria bacterium]|nr:TolC family protein [Candidatus Krumholzibacteria bacterium]HPD70360.1 TolC family protein [Candidatus Krumholzibacteria bacterium]HRY39940.1 TolC family protein [Candidatus Krumholzibacteria bacterium]